MPHEEEKPSYLSLHCAKLKAVSSAILSSASLSSSLSFFNFLSSASHLLSSPQISAISLFPLCQKVPFACQTFHLVYSFETIDPSQLQHRNLLSKWAGEGYVGFSGAFLKGTAARLLFLTKGNSVGTCGDIQQF